MTTGTCTIHRAEIWTTSRFRAHQTNPEDSFECFAAGALIVDEQGIIADVGDFAILKAQYTGAKVVDHPDSVIIPGFVDSHLHFPQLDMIGSHGKGLLDWLDHYTFPEEEKFASSAHAQQVARRLCQELKANGVTTAVMYSSAHHGATDALFAEAAKSGLRAIIGKVAMDRHCPASMQQPLESQIAHNEELMAKWHRSTPLLHYAITPRFAPACSPALLRALGDLKAAHPDVYVQSHHAETPEEVALVGSLFPEQKDYLSVYEDFGLLGAKTLLGHGIYTTKKERDILAETKTKIIHCPTSNLFLGSGLMHFESLRHAGVTVALGSDIGAGTSLSPFRTMTAAYKVQALHQNPHIPLHPVELLRLATLDGADALGLGHETGSLTKGKSADFVVLKPHRNRLLSERFKRESDPLIRLFATIIHGDDRLVDSAYVRGKCL